MNQVTFEEMFVEAIQKLDSQIVREYEVGSLVTYFCLTLNGRIIKKFEIKSEPTYFDD